MSRPITLTLLALTLVLPLRVLAQAGDLRAEIGKRDRAWEKAYNAGDAAGLTALYTKDAQVMAPGAETASGSSALQAYFTEDMKGGAKMALTLQDVVGFGDYALETGKYVATSAEGKHLDHGKFMSLYKKTDGVWKLYRDTWNSSMPPK